MTVCVSIIIPVYNTEKYLQECLDSVLSQNLNIEIICVDDGSTDNSLDVLNKYAQLSNKITVIKQENQGVSVARNNGLKVAKGEYVMFVDSDDWIEKDSLAQIYKSAKANESDMLFYRHDGYIKEQRIIGNFEYLQDYLLTQDIKKNIQLMYCAAFILFKKSFIDYNNIQFPVNIINAEDGVFNLECLYASPKISVSNQLVYHYRLDREGSACDSIKDLKGEIAAFMFTFNSKKYKETSLENQIITIEKYLIGIFSWYKRVSKRRGLKTKYIELIRLINFKKFLEKNVSKDILNRCQHYEYLKKYSIMGILSLYNQYSDNKCCKRKILSLFGLKIQLWKIKKNNYSKE